MVNFKRKFVFIFNGLNIRTPTNQKERVQGISVPVKRVSVIGFKSTISTAGVVQAVRVVLVVEVQGIVVPE